MQGTWVWSLGCEDPLEKELLQLEKEKAIHSSILAWRILWTIESMGSQGVGHDRVTAHTGPFWQKVRDTKAFPSGNSWTSRRNRQVKASGARKAHGEASNPRGQSCSHGDYERITSHLLCDRQALKWPTWYPPLGSYLCAIPSARARWDLWLASHPKRTAKVKATGCHFWN